MSSISPANAFRNVFLAVLWKWTLWRAQRVDSTSIFALRTYAGVPVMPESIRSMSSLGARQYNSAPIQLKAGENSRLVALTGGRLRDSH